MNYFRKSCMSGSVLILSFWFAAADAQTGYVVDEQLRPNEPSRHFGSVVAISGETAVVREGYPGWGVYVFERDGPRWGEPTKLTALPVGGSFPSWGESVAISGDTIIFGDIKDHDVDTEAGAAYVFVRQDGSWVQQAKLFASDAARVDWFGWSVAIDGDTIVVGARQAGVSGNRPGAAYVFHRTGSIWTQQAKLLASDGLHRDEFGRSVDISGDTVVVGALERQAAYVFQRTQSDWQEQAKLHRPVTWFGSSVAISDDTILVGAYASFCEHAGAYLYQRIGSSWSFLKQLPDERECWSTRAVDLDGDTAIVLRESGRIDRLDMVGGEWLRTGGYEDDDDVAWGAARLSGNTVLFGSPAPNLDEYAGVAKVIRTEQSFSDVSTDHWAFGSIEDISLSGITSGCGNNDYCPDDPVTRAQMAVFLERSMRGSDYSPPPATGNVFLDVSQGDFAAGFIEQLYADGITAGCGAGNYCPNDSVTRAQMAVLLLRAKYGAGFTPSPASGSFGDVDLSHWAVAWIEQLAAEGVTVGCGNGNYCPNDSVTRAQMAVFLVRTFGL